MRLLRIPSFIIVLILLNHLSCDLGLEIQDPYAARGVFDVTIREFTSEIRRVGGRDIIVVITKDTTYSGNDAVFSHSAGIIDVQLRNEEDSISVRLMGGAEGTALLGEYPIDEYEPNVSVQSNIFYGTAEAKLLGDMFTYFSENGSISIAMYLPNNRFRANFNFRTRVTSNQGNWEEPDSVRIIGAFNALIEK
jgi:hypothetical protein